MIQKLNIHDAFQALCKATKKWGVAISFGDVEDYADVEKAAPYLTLEDDFQIIISDGRGIILCDTEEEMNSIFHQTVGDDGPTELNSYNGPVRVYALTCSPDGKMLTENT